MFSEREAVNACREASAQASTDTITRPTRGIVVTTTGLHTLKFADAPSTSIANVYLVQGVLYPLSVLYVAGGSWTALY